LHVTLDGHGNLSGEIYRQIRRTILTGQLRPGDRLPPSRELARMLAVARATVTTAYEQLAAEGFVTSRTGSGTFVAETGVRTGRRVARTSSEGSLRPLPTWKAIKMPIVFEAPVPFDFRTGLPDASLFPHRTWRRLVSGALRSGDAASPYYGQPAGHRSLREAIARHVGISRGVEASADDVIITTGTQQALDLLARVLLAPGDLIAVEDPCYVPPPRLFRSHGARVVGVPVDDEGLVVDALPRHARVVYVTPSHQYPLGMAMTLARRSALLAWAERNNSTVIEDDYDSEFRFDGRPLEPLWTIDARGRVIYVGSFSKTMLPRLRLGFLIAPPSLMPALHTAKFMADFHTSTLEQIALARFIDDGGFARHVRKASRVYRERHAMIAETIERDFAPYLELVPSATGLHLAALARTASADDISAVAQRAAAKGVVFYPLSSLAVGAKARAGILLGYGAIAAEQIPEGMRRLRRCFGKS
jgi:GntR family transcriptional regulator/MocR family aminotransferase